MGFWLDNAFEAGKHIIVDCGYVRHANARNNADRLRVALGFDTKQARRKEIVAVVACGRVLVRVPKPKEHLLKRFRRIRQGTAYAWCTHVYDKNGPQFKLVYALK
jgi:2-oxoglutarate dehydrogenase complex dehydrogenase (E1) component-like enzyme